jgi:hypothetical protein
VWYSIRWNGYRCRTARRRRAGNLMRAKGSVKTAPTCAMDASKSGTTLRPAPSEDLPEHPSDLGVELVPADDLTKRRPGHVIQTEAAWSARVGTGRLVPIRKGCTNAPVALPCGPPVLRAPERAVGGGSARGVRPAMTPTSPSGHRARPAGRPALAPAAGARLMSPLPAVRSYPRGGMAIMPSTSRRPSTTV